MLKSKIRKKILNLRKSKNIHNIKLDFFKIYNILKTYNLKNKSVGGYYPINHELDDLNILKGLELKKIRESNVFFLFSHNAHATCTRITHTHITYAHHQQQKEEEEEDDEGTTRQQ